MVAAVSSGVMCGRQHGDVSFLVNKSILDVSNDVTYAKRFCNKGIVEMFIINMYMSCHGTVDRDLIISNCLADLNS